MAGLGRQQDRRGLVRDPAQRRRQAGAGAARRMSLKLSFDDDIRMLRDSAGRFFAEAEAAKALRRHRDARDFDALARGTWDGMAALGLTGTLVPEVFGGAGVGFCGNVPVAERIGGSPSTP